MLCIKKNKCFSTVLLLSQKKKNRQHTVIRSDLLKHVWTCRNTFQSVQTCWNLSKHVSIRSDLLKHVSRSPPPSPPSPSYPLFPFLWGGGGGGGGREGGGKPSPSPAPGWGRGGTKSPPPSPPDFKQKTIKILALFLLQNLQNLCNLPLPPKGFSLSPLLLLKTT